MTTVHMQHFLSRQTKYLKIPNHNNLKSSVKTATFVLRH